MSKNANFIIHLNSLPFAICQGVFRSHKYSTNLVAKHTNENGNKNICATIPQESLDTKLECVKRLDNRQCPQLHFALQSIEIDTSTIPSICVTMCLQFTTDNLMRFRKMLTIHTFTSAGFSTTVSDLEILPNFGARRCLGMC